MKIQERRLEEIQPYEKNPRKNEPAIEKVAESLKEFGWQQPIVVDAQGVIIAGHTRWSAARRLGLETAPVVVADGLSQEQVKAYRLADNKTGEMSDWLWEQLTEELERISVIDMERFGFFVPSPDDFGTDFSLTDEEHKERRYQITFSKEQWNDVTAAFEQAGFDPEDEHDRGRAAAFICQEWRDGDAD